MLKNLAIEVDEKYSGKAKMPSMPLTTTNLKGHSRMSSSLMGITETSSVFTDRYNVEAEKLDWTVAHLEDKHKKLYDACNSYKKDKA